MEIVCKTATKAKSRRIHAHHQEATINWCKLVVTMSCSLHQELARRLVTAAPSSLKGAGPPYPSTPSSCQAIRKAASHRMVVFHNNDADTRISDRDISYFQDESALHNRSTLANFHDLPH